jgi:hypothetical protein
MSTFCERDEKEMSDSEVRTSCEAEIDSPGNKVICDTAEEGSSLLKKILEKKIPSFIKNAFLFKGPRRIRLVRRKLRCVFYIVFSIFLCEKGMCA